MFGDIMTPEAIGASPVRQAIANASSATGADFNFLLATAVRESSLNPRAEARTSSATGLFQFLDATWLNTLKRHGAKHGLAAEANMINTSSDGIAYVENPALRRRLLDLRYDPEVSARMAAEFSNDNAEFIRARTGQEPQSGDLYAAHFLGAGGASELINAARNQPWARAADLFPAAASANRNVFYERGRAKSVIEVLEGLRATTGREPPQISDRELAFANNTMPNNMGMPQIWLSSMNQSMNMQTLGLLNNGAQNGPQNLMQDANFLAQIYQQADDSNQAQAMEAATSAFSTGSIAQALSPNEDNQSSFNGGVGQLRGLR